MNAFEQLEDFDNQSIQTIAFNMCKWFGFDGVEVNWKLRHDVESGMWISIKINYKQKTYYIDGQRNDIVRRRLVEWLKDHLARSRGS